MKVELKNVEKELAKLWEADASRARAARVELFTLVALVSEPRLLDRANAVLAKVAHVHECRTIAALWKPGDAAITADIDLHRDPDNKNEACGDAIVLEAMGDARDWLPGNVDRLLLPDLPAAIWWVGDLPDADDLFDRMVRRADVVLVNSAEMDLRDLEKLSQVVRACAGAHAFMDLTWVRLRGMQDLVARFFDDPHARPYLDSLEEVTFAYSPRDNETDVASTRAGLLLGWMGAALGFVADTAKWTRSANGGELVVGRENGTTVKLRFVQEKRTGVHDGAITRIEMKCAAGGKRARFELARQEDPNVMQWSCEVPDVATPTQMLKFASHDEADLLTRTLERPSRDRLLEASLRSAMMLVRPVAPRLSERPPRLT
jgi:glucose-6-phosphate dehydrogenase assembly protein OpcA